MGHATIPEFGMQAVSLALYLKSGFCSVDWESSYNVKEDIRAQKRSMPAHLFHRAIKCGQE